MTPQELEEVKAALNPTIKEIVAVAVATEKKAVITETKKAKQQIEADRSAASTGIAEDKMATLKAVRLEKAAILKKVKLAKKCVFEMAAMVLFFIAAFPIALYWSVIHMTTQFDAVWARVIVFCVPQVILGLVCIVAIIAHAREDR